MTAIVSIICNGTAEISRRDRDGSKEAEKELEI